MSRLRMIQWACAVPIGLCGTVVIGLMLQRQTADFPDSIGWWAMPLPILIIGWFVARYIEHIERRHDP